MIHFFLSNVAEEIGETKAQPKKSEIAMNRIHKKVKKLEGAISAKIGWKLDNEIKKKIGKENLVCYGEYKKNRRFCL